jgi:hypothetical protein
VEVFLLQEEEVVEVLEDQDNLLLFSIKLTKMNHNRHIEHIDLHIVDIIYCLKNNYVFPLCFLCFYVVQKLYVLNSN